MARVQKPTRYLGAEWNAVSPSPGQADLSIALAYPDVYEIGQSHLGLRILYGIAASMEGLSVERVFAPWPDLEEIMRQEGIPLFTLETWRPLMELDLLGFSLQYELTYTNILNMLSLAGIPMRARERDDRFPLILGGGPGAFNPEPLAEFFDSFFLGDAEEGFREILALLLKAKEERRPRSQTLKDLAKVPGIYVPSFYEITYAPDGTTAAIKAEPWAPMPVKKRLLQEMAKALPRPSCYVVPHMEIVHDRAMLEILRGCTHGCRFCQAGMIYRPVRERPLADLRQDLQAMVAATGLEEISLTSLSSTDHPEIEEMLREFSSTYGRNGINVTLPSLRADRFSLALAAQMQGARKTSLTFAPEAGSERLRHVINKDLSDEQIVETVTAAFTAGWQRLKLYFMIGLPTETEEDLRAMAALARRILAIGRRHTGRAAVVVSVSTFVPKAHTPFQWRPQIGLEETRAKQALLQELICGRGLELQWHQAEQSILEGVIARGDRRIAETILEAWRLGCKFDGWQEWFDYAKWEEAMASARTPKEFYTARPRAHAEVLPWDHLQSGVAKAYLMAEDRHAEAEEMTPDCRRAVCSGCGVCPAYGFAERGETSS